MRKVRSKKMCDEAPACWMGMKALEDIGTTCGGMAVAVYTGLCYCQGRYHRRQWFPATDRHLAGLLGLARNTVRLQVGKLVECGFVLKKKREGGTSAPSLYALVSIEGVPSISRTPVEDDGLGSAVEPSLGSSSEPRTTRNLGSVSEPLAQNPGSVADPNVETSPVRGGRVSTKIEKEGGRIDREAGRAAYAAPLADSPPRSSEELMDEISKLDQKNGPQLKDFANSSEWMEALHQYIKENPIEDIL